MSDSIYKSHTHGPIPLSATGKQLMQTLRIAIREAIQKGDYNQSYGVAHARGELAAYMSRLEAKPMNVAPAITYDKLMADMRESLNNRVSNVMGGTLTKGTFTWTGSPANLQNLPRLSGNKGTVMILDDIQDEQELDMSKQAVAARKKVAKTQAKLQLVGVRFLHGHNLDKIYTYKAKRAAKLHLGQEVVIRNSYGTNVAIVVQLDQPMPAGYNLESVVELTDKVAAL